MGLSSQGLEPLLARRVLANIATNRCTQTVYQGHQPTIWRLCVQYPLVVTASPDNIIKLWCFGDTKGCRWTFNHVSTVHELKLLEDKVIGMGQDVEGVNGDIAIQMISCRTGKHVAVYKKRK